MKPLGERTGGRIIGMVSMDDRPEEAADRRVPGAWEGDLVIGRGGGAIATQVERHSRFLIMLGLPEGKKANGLADILINRVNDLPVYFAHSSWERPSTVNTNGLIREYLPKGIELTSHQPYLDSTADELNDHPRAVLGFRTPKEVFTKLLNDDVAKTA